MLGGLLRGAHRGLDATLGLSMVAGRGLATETRTVTLIPGDGIGPEIAQAVQKCVNPLEL